MDGWMDRLMDGWIDGEIAEVTPLLEEGDSNIASSNRSLWYVNG